MRWQTIILGPMLQVILVFSSQYPKNLNIWPMPESVEYGNQTFYLSKDFHLTTDGSKYKDASGILKDGFARLLDVVTANNVIEYNFGKVYDYFLLQGIRVVVHSESDELQYNIDESYKLYIHPQGNPVYANIEAATVYGALHALQTFSQLCHFNLKTRKIVVNQVPWTITDRPRFSYRGLLIDTSRHYQPLRMIKKVIDSMAYAKLNVMHWHIVDRESFPLEIPSFPKLWNGAYSITERYTMAAAADIVRQVNDCIVLHKREDLYEINFFTLSYFVVMLKEGGSMCLLSLMFLDMLNPGGLVILHYGHRRNVKEPLDVSSDFTFKLIDGVLSDFSKIFKYRFVHLGGDEVDTSCWSSTPRIQKWLEQKGLNESQAYEYFVLKAQKIAVSHGYEVINWEETFNQFGSKLDRKTIVHNWLGSGVAERVVATGLRCIVSNQDKWYLDHLDTDWSTFYMNEPLTNITNPEQQELVLGGEVCMWGETVDGSDIEQTIWPRATAAAERLWTRFDKLPKDPSQVASRLANFRCLLNQRGVAAAPLDGLGRAPPIEAGSCYVQ